MAKPKRRWLNPVVLVALVLALLILPYSIVKTRSDISRIQLEERSTRQVELATNNEILTLEALEARRRDLARRDAFLNKQLRWVLRACRRAEDIPWLSSDFIVGEVRSVGAHTGASIFYVPAGSHDLVVEFNESIRGIEKLHHQVFPLHAESGYRLDFVYDEDAAESPFRVQLRSGREDKGDRIWNTPVMPMAVRSSSRRTARVFAFPSEVDGPFEGERSQGVTLLDFSWRSKEKGNRVRAKALLVSDSPPCANPANAFRIEVQDRMQPIKYVGGGRFELPGYGR